jgi:putative sigma-54 modulation protein
VEITVSARNTEVPDAVRRSAVDKVGKLSKYVEGMDRGEVHFTRLRNPRIPDGELCEIVLEGHGHVVRCKVNAADPGAAVDKAVAKLEHQLHKLKTKLQRRTHGAPKAKAAEPVDTGEVDVDLTALTDDTDVDTDGEVARIVKTKHHSLKPMVPDEAALQLDLLGHDFYFFTNADTGRAAVLYRRDDGDLGLIDEGD